MEENICLQTLDRKLKKYLQKENENYIGWKVFNKRNGKLFSLVQRYRMITNRWIINLGYTPFKIHTSSGKLYPVGFHIFLTKAGAKMYINLVQDSYDENKKFTIKKVSFKHPLTFGNQCGQPVVVSREIFIHKGSKI